MSEFAKHIKKLAKSPYLHIQQATVVSVDESKRTCVVKLLVSDAEIPDVRLNAVEDEETDFFVMIPKDKSLVWIGFADESNEAVVIAVSVTTKIMFNGGKQKGMLLHDKVKRELNKLEQNTTILKNATNAIAMALDALVPGTSGIFATSVAAMQAQLDSDLENKKILQ